MLVNERAARMAARVRTEGLGAAINRHAVTITLVVILVFGGALRFTGRNWDDGNYLHPDERFMTMVATGIHWPASVSAYFDSANSPLNPYNNDFGTFIYGTFPLFLAKAIGDLTGQNVYGNFHLAGRSMSATFDMLTILLVFLVGRRLFNPFAGLIAAFLMSTTVLSIQSSHYFTVDAALTCLCLAVFYWALRAYDSGRWWVYALSGVMVGLALATKLSALPIVAVLGLPLVEAIRTGGWHAALRKPNPRALPPILGVALALICVAWTFRIAQPYAFASGNPLDFRFDPRWREDVRRWGEVRAGHGGDPPSRQWANRPPLIFVVDNLVKWGLGIPLGVAALAGVALGGLRLVTAKRWPPTWQVILVGWSAFHVVYYGVAVQKSLRYVYPAYPYLVLLAAGLLAALWAHGIARPTWDWRKLALVPLPIVLIGTALYAIAFTSIYTRTSTRIEASLWIYDNIPAGTHILNEHWDDGIPYGLPGHFNGDYPSEQLELYNNDDEEKLATLLTQLDGADYIFVTSNRLYKSIPRMPERYPMTIEYYKMLFSGDLGFDLVKTVTSRPQIFGIEIDDDNSEESFTVYDHPKVLIFKKTAAFSRATVAARLAPKLDGDIVNIEPNQAGYNLLMMSDSERRTQQAGGTWRDIFDRTGISNRHPVRIWYLGLQLMALAIFPLCWRVLGGLPDRGYAVAKTIGLLFAGWVAWLLASLHIVDFGRGAVLIGIGLAAALSIAAVAPRWRAFGRDLRGRWPEILVAELVFLAAFFVFVWFRSKNPDLWHPWRGGEKPMEFAYFNAVIRSTHFPPYDPWFAGGYINYYYFGYALLAAVVRLTGVIPSVAFNLAVPTCFALLVLNAWSFTTGMIRLLASELKLKSRWAPLALGLLGPLFVAVIGNLDMARRIGDGDYGYPESTSHPLGWIGDIVRGTWRFVTNAHPLPTNAFWDPSRIMDGTINEFPYFTMLFADFHPHLIALPFSSAALLVALSVLLARRWPDETTSGPIESDAVAFGFAQNWRGLWRAIPWDLSFDRALLIGLTALVTGALYPLNTWDFPTYVGITAGAFLLLELVAAGTWRLSFATLRRAAIWAAATVVLGRLLFWPYFANYAIPNSGFDKWEEPVTRPGQYLLIHGILLFFVVSFLLAELAATMPSLFRWRVIRPTGLAWRLSNSEPATDRRLDASLTFGSQAVALRPILLAGTGMAFVLLVAVWKDKLLLLLAGLLALTAVVAWQRRREPIHLFLLGMVAVALLISGAVERYTLRGDIGRMNTVFKFYLQIWVLLALVAAVGAVVVVTRYRNLVSRRQGVIWAGLAILLVLAGLAYPVQATPARLDDRFQPMKRNLDGMAYMAEAVYDDGGPDGGNSATYALDGDYEAIRWLQDNVDGSPVILEGVTPLYRWGSRVSIYTGLPTVLGWDWHQTQQRYGYGTLITKRMDEVKTMLGGRGSFASIRPLLDKYHVRYIYIGDLERTYYSSLGLRKFDQAVANGTLTVVYDARGVKIYRYDGAPK